MSLAVCAAALTLAAVQLTFTGSAQGPLPNGVAAGDTTFTSTVLWARGTTVGPVLFEYSTDPTFSTGVLTTTTTITDPLQPVKVAVSGLSPATAYAYRVTDSAAAAGQGQFRTPTITGSHAGLRFGVSGDWEAELAPYPSISNADERDLDFFVEHGDTIVAGSSSTLTDFRQRHNEVYSTYLGLNTWADLRASTSILATIDDNEVRNDFAGGAHPSSDPRFDNNGSFINETQLFNTALQAFNEYNPISDTRYGATGDLRTAGKHKLYRFRTYGDDGAVFILDTRSFRDEQLEQPTDEAEALQFLIDSMTLTDRTIFGAQQLADLKADLQQVQADGITWKFVFVPDPIQNLGLFKAHDRFEGYAAERNDLLRFIKQNNIYNVVFIAAGLHGTVVNNITYQDAPLGSQFQTGAFEVIASPVAIDPTAGPFGPVLIEDAEANGLITPTTRALYDSLDRTGKDNFVKDLMDEYLLAPVGYDLIGLNGSEIQATLLGGSYVAAHTYGWAEFDVDQMTQALTVTIYGIDYYTETLLLNDPNEVISRTPEIVSQFVVAPGPFLTPVDMVTISGPSTGMANVSYQFVASVSPISATTPVTYTWQASEQGTVIQTNNLSDTVPFTWATTGTKTITVSANNALAEVIDTHTINIDQAQGTVAPESVVISGPSTGAIDVIYQFDATVSPLTTTTPLTYTWQATDKTTVVQTNNLSDTVAFSWGTTGTKTITVTVSNGSLMVSDSHTFDITSAIMPADNTLDRRREAAIIKGSKTPSLIGTPINHLFVYSYTDSGWGGQVPVQVDEINASGEYVTGEDGLLDANDEIVIMSKDLGNRPAFPLSLGATLPISATMYELEVVDPLEPTRKGWVYLVGSGQLTSSFSADYVDYITATQQISGSDYDLGLSITHLGLDDLTLNSSGVEILDRTKLRVVLDTGIFGIITVTENALGSPPGSEPVLIKDGPTRVIVQRTLDSGSVGVDIHSLYQAYGSSVHGTAALTLTTVPGVTIERVRTTLDFNSAVSPSTFYNANVPLGVTIDGNPDAGVDTTLSNWFQVSHSSGRFIQVSNPAPLGADVATFYQDDDVVVDEDPTGDGLSYGEVGFRLEDDINLASILQSNFYVLPPGGNVGATYEQYFFNPLDTETRLLTALDAITINGPVTGLNDADLHFSADFNPDWATLPISYTWQATDQGEVTQTDNVISFSWPTTGTKIITVTAFNGGPPVSNSHSLIIGTDGEEETIYLPLVTKN